MLVGLDRSSSLRFPAPLAGRSWPRWPRRDLRARAFTLIELLAVIAIIATVMGFVLPSLAKSREAARRVKCLANLRAFGPAFEMYRKDFKEVIPRAAPFPGIVTGGGGGPVDPGIHEALGNYLETTPNIKDPDNPSVYKRADPYWCPSDNDPEAGATAGISYFYWGGALMYAREIFAADQNPTFTVSKFYEGSPKFPVLADVRAFHPDNKPLGKNALYFGDWRADTLDEDPQVSMSGP